MTSGTKEHHFRDSANEAGSGVFPNPASVAARNGHKPGMHWERGPSRPLSPPKQAGRPRSQDTSRLAVEPFYLRALTPKKNCGRIKCVVCGRP